MRSIAFSSVHLLLCAVIAGALQFIFVPEISAQASRNPSAAARRIEEFTKKSDQVARDEMNREMIGKKPSAEEKLRAKAIEAEIRQDLDALQTDYNDAVEKLNSRKEITPEFASEIAARVRKHSDRLKSNIKFPEAKSDEPISADKPQTAMSMRKKLVDLCTHILAFFNSPMFESPNVLDIPAAQKARRSLEAVIRESSELKELVGTN